MTPRVGQFMIVFALLLLPAIAVAQRPLVQDGALDVHAGTLQLSRAGACCTGSSCQASFLLKNKDAWEGTLHNIEIQPGALRGAGYLPANQLAFAPNTIASLAPGEERVVVATLRVPSTRSGGHYSGSIDISALSGGYRTTLPVEVELCEPPRPSLVILPGHGDYDGSALTLVGKNGDCHADEVTSSFVVRNDGTTQLSTIRASLDLEGLTVTFSPRRASLAPHDRVEFSLTAHVSIPLPAGPRTGWLHVRDDQSGTSVKVPTVYQRCTGPVEPPADPRPTEPGPTVLSIRHEITHSAVRPGQLVTLRITVDNASDSSAREVVVTDTLPIGFVYARGRTAIDGLVGSEPEGTQKLRWRLAEIPPRRSRTIAFQVSVTSAAPQGRVVARASAELGKETFGPVEVATEIVYGSKWLGASVEGVVYDNHDQPLHGVEILLDYDRSTVTDDHGRFEFHSVRGGDHLVAIDRRSLSAGLVPLAEERLLVHLFSGATQRVEFRVGHRTHLVMRLEERPPRGKTRVAHPAGDRADR